MQVNKPFSQQHYDEDDNAKYQIMAWLETKGHKCRINPDRYGIDILAERWGKQFQFEIEVKHNWSGRLFPFQTVHFSARKRKFITVDCESWFVMLNNERSHALFILDDHVLASPVVWKNTKYSQNEAFVEVDVQHGIFRNLNEEVK